MKLVIGNKNYSSWSFRPWIVMKALGIPFEEILIPFSTPLGNPEFRQRLSQYTPAGLVPVLIDGDVHVWETLAIMEYLAEKFPDKQLWPADVKKLLEPAGFRLIGAFAGFDGGAMPDGDGLPADDHIYVARLARPR